MPEPTFAFTISTAFGPVDMPPVTAEEARNIARINIENALSFSVAVNK